MIKHARTILYIIAFYISVAGLVTFSQFISEEAFQTVMFGTWPAKNAKQWHLVKTGSELMVTINDQSRTINKYFGWIQPLAYFAYDAYCDSADYYIKGLRSEVFANAPELFIREPVEFEFMPNKISFTESGLFLASNGRMGVITDQDIKLEPLLISGVLTRYKNLYVVYVTEKPYKEVPDGNSPERSGQKNYTTANLQGS